MYSIYRQRVHITEEREEICSIEKGPRREVNQPLVRIDASSFAPRKVRLYVYTYNLYLHGMHGHSVEPKKKRYEMSLTLIDFHSVLWHGVLTIRLPWSFLWMVLYLCKVCAP